MEDDQLRIKVEKIFKHFDQDQSGFLDKEELSKFLHAMEKSLNNPNFKVTDKMVDTFFEYLDKDHNNQVTFEELYASIKKMVKKM